MKETEPQETRMMVDEEYNFYGFYDRNPEGRCRVRIVEKIGGGHVVIITELPDNQSTSVTNLMEFLAPEIIREFFELPFEELEGPTIVEHYPADQRNPETYDLVSFSKRYPHKVWLGGRERLSFGEPEWTHLAKETLVAMVGGAIDLE